MISKTRLSARLGALIALLAMLFTLFPVAISAEEATAASIEPMLLRADDYTEAVTGFHLFADNPDNLPLQISYAIYKASDTSAPVAIPDNWVNITAIEPTTGDADAAQTARPVFAVDFHKPADINVEDPEYIESPACLRAVTVNGSPVYALAPGYIAAFRIVGGTAAEDGTYPLDHTLTWQSEMPIVTFDLDRPAKLITHLTQNEGEHGTLDVHVLNSDSIRSLYDRLMNTSKDTFLTEYGLTDAQLYIQYDQTRMDVPSSYDAEADDSITEVWSPETLQVLFQDFDLNVGFRAFHSHSFDEDAFRACFPEGTFTEKVIDDGDDAAEDSAVWVIDTETVSLAIRARYVLALTAADGTVYYTKTAFTDPFYCGASNSLVTDPTALEAPVLSDPTFETAEDGSVTLSYDIGTNTSVRDTMFWCLTNDRGNVGWEIELSVNGSDWTPYDAALENAVLLELGGRITFPVSAELLSEYAYIRVRMRYTAEAIPLQSEWSAPLAFDIKPPETVTAPESEVTLPLYTESTAGEGELKYVCPICGFCPAPYGVCLFLWLGAALLIVLLIVLIIALIPKKKYCPRCSAACKPQDKSCTTCGYRFVGSMPEIEDTTGDITLPKEKTQADLEQEEDFFDNALRDGAKKAPRVTPVHVNIDEPEIAPAPKSEEPQSREKTPAAPVTVTPAPAAKPDAAFVSELKRKMAAVKAGQKVSFTPEEIAYIKVLKEKAAAKNVPAAPVSAPAAPVQPQTSAEVPTAAPQTEPVVTARPAPTETPVQEESREAQIARLRALRAKQLSAEDTAKAESAKPAEAPAETPRRVEKPVKQIKCPACAVPNPETNGQCYICGTRLK